MYLNNLTQLKNNLIHKFIKLFQMQLVRRPYYIKHAFSTLIGTPAQILIENTMIASIRGLTTQSLSMNKITRKNEIDLR